MRVPTALRDDIEYGSQLDLGRRNHIATSPVVYDFACKMTIASHNGRTRDASASNDNLAYWFPSSWFGF